MPTSVHRNFLVLEMTIENEDACDMRTNVSKHEEKEWTRTSQLKAEMPTGRAFGGVIDTQNFLYNIPPPVLTAGYGLAATITRYNFIYLIY